MKSFLKKYGSIIVAAALATGITLGLCMFLQPGSRVRYVYVNSKLDQLENLINEKFVGEKDKTKLEDMAAAAMVGATGDRWSYYISAEEFASYTDNKNNSFVGIGVTVSTQDTAGGMPILSVTEGGPAAEAGVLPGDIIVGVDGTDVRGMDSAETKNRIRGEEGTEVTVTVTRGGSEHSFVIVRRRIKTQVAKGSMLEGNIGLVKIANFNENCADETIAAIDALLEQGMEKLILDVRNNPGGYARELVKVLDYLLPTGEVFRAVGYDGTTNVSYSDAKCLQIPMVVMMNRDSYSAAEFFGAALREYEAAVVVGEQTCGKGYYQNTFMLQDGSAVALSVGKYYTPKGENLAGVGITPDIPVAVDDAVYAAIAAGTLNAREDPQILAAMEVLKN